MRNITTFIKFTLLILCIPLYLTACNSENPRVTDVCKLYDEVLHKVRDVSTSVQLDILLDELIAKENGLQIKYPDQPLLSPLELENEEYRKMLDKRKELTQALEKKTNEVADMDLY